MAYVYLQAVMEFEEIGTILGIGKKAAHRAYQSGIAKLAEHGMFPARQMQAVLDERRQHAPRVLRGNTKPQASEVAETVATTWTGGE